MIPKKIIKHVLVILESFVKGTQWIMYGWNIWEEVYLAIWLRHHQIYFSCGWSLMLWIFETWQKDYPGDGFIIGMMSSNTAFYPEYCRHPRMPIKHNSTRGLAMSLVGMAYSYAILIPLNLSLPPFIYSAWRPICHIQFPQNFPAIQDKKWPQKWTSKCILEMYTQTADKMVQVRFNWPCLTTWQWSKQAID